LLAKVKRVCAPGAFECIRLEWCLPRVKIAILLGAAIYKSRAINAERNCICQCRHYALPIKSNASTLSAGCRVKLCAHPLCQPTLLFCTSLHVTFRNRSTTTGRPSARSHTLRARQRVVGWKFHPISHIYIQGYSAHTNGCSALQELQC
jgi:hypothetical protein